MKKFIYYIFLVFCFLCSSLFAANSDRLYTWKCIYCGAIYNGEKPPEFSICLRDNVVFDVWILVKIKDKPIEES